MAETMNEQEKIYNDKALDALAEMKAILKKYDMAGSFVVVTPTGGRFNLHLETSWNGLKHTEDGVRLRSLKKELGDSKKEIEEGALHSASSIHEISLVVSSMVKPLVDKLMHDLGGVRFDREVNLENEVEHNEH